MPHTVTAAQVLDREFLTIRCKLLEVAAIRGWKRSVKRLPSWARTGGSGPNNCN